MIPPIMPQFYKMCGFSLMVLYSAFRELFDTGCSAIYFVIKTKIWFRLSGDLIVRLVFSSICRATMLKYCKSTETSVKWKIPLEPFIKKWHLCSYKPTNKLQGNSIKIAKIVYKSYVTKMSHLNFPTLFIFYKEHELPISSLFTQRGHLSQWKAHKLPLENSHETLHIRWIKLRNWRQEKSFCIIFAFATNCFHFMRFLTQVFMVIHSK